MTHITEAVIYLPQAATAPAGEGRRIIGYEYAEDADHILHPVHRAGTPWRCQGLPAAWVGTSLFAAEVANKLPDEEHGAKWGAPIRRPSST